jgi:hypothetical protein
LIEREFKGAVITHLENSFFIAFIGPFVIAALLENLEGVCAL